MLRLQHQERYYLIVNVSIINVCRKFLCMESCNIIIYFIIIRNINFKDICLEFSLFNVAILYKYYSDKFSATHVGECLNKQIK